MGNINEEHVTQIQQHLCCVKCFKSFGMLRSLGKNSQKQELSITARGMGYQDPTPASKAHTHTQQDLTHGVKVTSFTLNIMSHLNTFPPEQHERIVAGRCSFSHRRQCSLFPLVLYFCFPLISSAPPFLHS